MDFNDYKHMMLGIKNRKSKESGQSAIEFIVVVVVLLFFLMFFLSLSILLVVSDYIEYATFMAARTYKSMYSTRAVQERNARTVFNSYTKNVQGIARNMSISFVGGGQRGDQAAGVKSSYTIDLFYLPPIFVPGTIPSAVNLTSETRLGRDPANEDCFNYFTKFVQMFGLGLNDSKYISLMDDNGC